MDILIMLTYGAITIAVFKLFRVQVNGFTILTAVVRRVLMRMKSWTNFVFSDGHSLPIAH